MCFWYKNFRPIDLPFVHILVWALVELCIVHVKASLFSYICVSSDAETNDCDTRIFIDFMYPHWSFRILHEFHMQRLIFHKNKENRVFQMDLKLFINFPLWLFPTKYWKEKMETKRDCQQIPALKQILEGKNGDQKRLPSCRINIR